MKPWSLIYAFNPARRGFPTDGHWSLDWKLHFEGDLRMYSFTSEGTSPQIFSNWPGLLAFSSLSYHSTPCLPQFFFTLALLL